MSNYKNILSHNDCLSQEQMQAYLRNTLDKQAAHQVEHHLTDCMFCSDALEGLQLLTTEENEKHIGDIQSSIEQLLGLDTDIEQPKPLNATANDVGEKELENIAEPLQAKKGGKRISWMAAAGIFFLIFASGLVVFSYIQNNTDWIKADGLVKNTSTSKEINLDESKTNGRELETYTLDSDYLAATESVEEIDNNSAANNNVRKEEKINSTSIAKSKEIVARNDDKIKAIPAPESQNSALLKTIEENRMAVNEKEKRDQLVSNDAIAKTEREQLDVTNNPNLAGSRNTYSQPLFDGKMKDIQNAPAVGQVETKKVGKSSKYSQAEESAKEIDAIQIQGLSKKGQVSLTNYEQGFNAYNKAKYTESINYLKRALKQKDLKNREETLYLLALAYEKTNEMAKAREIYEQLSTSKDFENRARSRMIEMPAK